MLSTRKESQHEANNYITRTQPFVCVDAHMNCRQRPNFLASSEVLAFGSPAETKKLVVCESKPLEIRSFMEHDPIQSVLPSLGDTTTEQTGDETIDLTGISLSGCKEIK